MWAYLFLHNSIKNVFCKICGFFFCQIMGENSSSVHFSHSVMTNSLQPHGLWHTRPPCPSPTPRVYSNSCPLNQWCHLNILPLSSPSPPTFNLSQHQSLFQWISSSHQVAKVLELQLQHQSFQLRVDVFELTGFIRYIKQGRSRVSQS